MASPDAAGAAPSPTPGRPTPSVLAVAASAGHTFSKRALARIHLLEGLGVQGDAHLGRTVQHLSRVRRDPNAANLRQVHLSRPSCSTSCGRRATRWRPGSSVRT